MPPRIVSGPEITGLVLNSQTNTPIGGATITVSKTVYTDPDFTTATTTLTADGYGVFFCYATNGTYTFTTTAAGAAPIESVTVRGSGAGSGAAVPRGELSRAQIETGVTTTSTGDVDVDGLLIEVDYQGLPITIEFAGHVRFSAGTGTNSITITIKDADDGTTVIGLISVNQTQPNSQYIKASWELLDPVPSPAIGLHRYKVAFHSGVGTLTAQLNAGAQFPVVLKATEHL